MQSRFTWVLPPKNHKREPKQRKMSRIDRLRKRTKGHCSYCGVYVPKEQSTRDHVIPRAKGGETKEANLLLCCKECNQRKSDLDLEDFRDLYFGGLPFWVEVLEGDAA